MHVQICLQNRFKNCKYPNRYKTEAMFIKRMFLSNLQLQTSTKFSYKFQSPSNVSEQRIVRNLPLVFFITVFFSLPSYSVSFSRNFFNFSFISPFDIFNYHTLTTKSFVSYFIILIFYLYCLLSENLSRFPQILVSIIKRFLFYGNFFKYFLGNQAFCK